MCGITPSPAGAKNMKVVKHVTWVSEISADKIHDRLFGSLGVACWMDVLLFSIHAPADEPFDNIFVHTHTLRDRHKHTHTHICTLPS